MEAIAVHGDRLAYVRNEDGTSRLTLDGRPVGDLPTGVVGGLAFSPDGTRSHCTSSPADGPTDVWVVVATTSRASPARPSAASPADLLQRPELRSLTASTARGSPTCCTARATRRRVCHVHGGPESQARPALNAVIQYLSARGIGVAVPNVRGSTGYGKTFGGLDDVELRPTRVARPGRAGDRPRRRARRPGRR